MTISALAYNEILEEFTPSNVINDEPTDGYFFVKELDLPYPGHFGKGFFVLTGDWRCTNLSGFSYCSMHIYSDLHELTYGTVGGYPYDTDWHNFSIIAGWDGDLPHQLHFAAMIDASSLDRVAFRNVRLAFVQIADVAGLKVSGRDANTAGYHVAHAEWDYSALAAIGCIPNQAKSLWASSKAFGDTKIRDLIMHVNGLVVGGDGSGNANTTTATLNFVTGAASAGIAHIRPQSGFYNSYGWIAQRETTSFSMNVTISNSNTSSNNITTDIYGGHFLMVVERDANTDNYHHDPSSYSISGTSQQSTTFEPGEEGDSVSRYLVFGAGRARVANGSLQTSVACFGDEMSVSNTTFKGGSANNNGQSFFTFTNGTTGSNSMLTVDHEVSSANTGHLWGPVSGFSIKLDRNYVKSATGIPTNALNVGSGVVWSGLTNLYVANTDAYASQVNPLTSAARNKYLYVGGFGFDEFIPEDAEIGYIWMYPVYRKSGSGGLVWDNVRMYAGGAVQGSSAAWSTAWTKDWASIGPDINFGVSTYWDLDFNPAEGGSATRNGIWNYRPTADQVRDTDFGFQMRLKSTSGSATAQVAYVKCVVYYRIPGETFVRSVTANAGTISTSIIDTKDVSKVVAETGPTTIELLKDTAKANMPMTQGATTLGSRMPIKDAAVGIATAITNYTHDIAKSLDLVKTPTTLLRKRTAKAPVALTLGKVLSGAKRAIKTYRFVPTFVSVWNKDVFKADTDLTANNVAFTSKRATKDANLTQGKVAALLKTPRKAVRTTQASVKRLRKSARKVWNKTLGNIASVLNRKYTTHHINLAITAVTTTTVRKAMSMGHSLTQASTAALLVIRVKILNLIATSTHSVAPLIKTALKHPRAISTAVLDITKATAARRSTVTDTTTTVAKRTQKSDAFTLGHVLELTKASAKTLPKRTIGKTVRLTKKMLQSVQDLTSAVVVDASKRTVKTLEVVQGKVVALRKAATRRVRAVSTSVKRLRKATVHGLSTAFSHAVSIRKMTRLTESMTATATLLSFRKGITHRLPRRTIGKVVSLVPDLLSRALKILFEIRETAFHLVSEGVLRMTTPVENSSYTYSDFEVLYVPTHEEVTLKPSITETETVTIPAVDQVVIKL